MIVEGQQNIKVHLATAEQNQRAVSMISAGSRYNLGTAFPFVWSLFNGKKKGGKPRYNALKTMEKLSRHYILDSGLFTLMFGAHKGKKDEAYIEKWQECLIEFIRSQNYTGTAVEVDCQVVLGPKKAWDLRRKMKEALPNNRIINVFHLPDGQRGLDELIEFSEYIAISVPELRFAGKKNHVSKIAHYIKNKKPEIDIHLLGMTEKKLLKELNFCSSADSSSWTSGLRYGELETLQGKKHIKFIKQSIIDQFAKKWLATRDKHFPEVNRAKDMRLDSLFSISAYEFLKIYRRSAGCQK